MRKRTKIYEPVFGRDISERYDASRSAVGIKQFFENMVEMVCGNGLSGAEIERAERFKENFDALPEDVQFAVDDYWQIEQRWDAMPIPSRLRCKDGEGAKPFPFTPAVYRTIKGYNKTEFLRWLIKIDKAQDKLPELTKALGFHAGTVLTLYGGPPAPPHRTIRIRPTSEDFK